MFIFFFLILAKMPKLKVGWDMPTGYDDEGLRITKYEVELRLLRTYVETIWVTDLDVLSASFTGLECNSEYRVRVRAWNMYTNTDSAAGPWGYSPFRKTRGCPLPSAPSEVTVFNSFFFLFF
jgi:hypothetical protein